MNRGQLRQGGQTVVGPKRSTGVRRGAPAQATASVGAPAPASAVSLNALEEIAGRYGLGDESTAIADRRRDEALPLLIVVAGEGNFGKSSLINALAGREVAPVSRLPLTWKVDVYWALEGGAEHAVVRRIGDADGLKVGIDEARRMVADEEALLRSNPARKPDIVEVIWRLAGLELPTGVALVDTPGVSATGLGVSVRSETLLRGLGAVYVVDDVWHYYYHRADVVLWLLEATQMESEATVRALREVSSVYHKDVIPVATKVDRVERSRWSEIERRFGATYGKLMSDGLIAKRLWLTACGAKGEFRGFGVEGLRQHLVGLAPLAESAKQEATRAFVRDTARRIHYVLTEGSEQLVTNIRTVADTADEVALAAMREIEKSAERTRQAVTQRLNRVAIGNGVWLEKLAIELVYQKIDKARFVSSVKGNLELESIGQSISDTAGALYSAISSIARATSGTRRLARARVGSTGKVTKDTFAFELAVVNPKIPVFSTPPLPETPPTTGFWQDFKRLLNVVFGNRYLTEEEKAWLTQYRVSLRSFAAPLPGQSATMLRSRTGPALGAALREATEQAVASLSGLDAMSVIAELERVDRDLVELARMGGLAGISQPRYADWARYWTAHTRDVTLVRRLLAHVASRSVSGLQQHIAGQVPIVPPSIKRRVHRGVRSGAQMVVAEPVATSASPMSALAPGVLRSVGIAISDGIQSVGSGFVGVLVGVPVTVVARWEMRDWLKQLQVGGKDPITELCDWLAAQAAADPTLGEVLEQARVQLPDVALDSVSEDYAEAVVGIYREALGQSLHQVRSTASASAVSWFGLPVAGGFRWTPFGFLATGVAVPVTWLLCPRDVYLPMNLPVTSVTEILTWGCGMMLLLLGIGVRSVRWDAFGSLASVAESSCRDWAAAGLVTVAGRIDAGFVEGLANRFAVRVNPRPLMRLEGGVDV